MIACGLAGVLTRAWAAWGLAAVLLSVWVASILAAYRCARRQVPGAAKPYNHWAFYVAWLVAVWGADHLLWANR